MHTIFLKRFLDNLPFKTLSNPLVFIFFVKIKYTIDDFMKITNDEILVWRTNQAFKIFKTRYFM